MTDRQLEIINVSLDLISESGIQALTIKNLAKKIGFSESAIYRHYENKIQILLAILEYFRENTERLFSEAAAGSGSNLEKIEKVFISHFKKFSATPSLVPVIFSEELFRNEPQLEKKVGEIIKKNSEVLVKLIKVGQEKGEIRSDIKEQHLALILMGSLRMFVKNWHLSNYKFDLITGGEEFIASVINLLKK